MKNLWLALLLLPIANQCLMGQNFTQITFPVSKDGENLAFPFAGGVNAPQFNLADINRDGKNELVVFDRDGAKVMVFEKVGAAGDPDYIYRPEWSSSFPDMIEFMILRDYNNDEIPDIFTFSQLGIPGIQVFSGAVEDGQLKFELLEIDQDFHNVLAIRDGGNLVNLDVSNIDLPFIVDVDGDGDLDILAFSSAGGSARYFKNRTVEEGRNPEDFIFKLEDRCWGKFFESEFSEDIFLSDDPDRCASFNLEPQAELRHAGSTISLFDAQGNGLWDALIGDFTSNNLIFLENGGSPSNAWIVDSDVFFPSYDQSVDIPLFNASFILDINGNGKDDMVVAPNGKDGFGETKNLAWYYKNVGAQGEHIFELQQKDFLGGDMIDVGSRSVVAVADVDGDGLLDLVVGGTGSFENFQERISSLFYFRNTGTPENPEFELADEDLFGLSQFSSNSRGFAPVFFDVNGNGALDVIVGDHRGQLYYGENQAQPGEPIQINNWIYPWMNINVGQYARPAVADLNGDGLPDLVIGEQTGNNVDNRRCGNLNYFQNMGTSNAPEFMADVNQAPNNPCFGEVLTVRPGSVIGFSAPSFARSGDELILLVGGIEGKIRQYNNLDPSPGVVFDPVTVEFGGIDEGSHSQAVLADLNRSGHYEVVVANQRGGISLFESDLDTANIVSDGLSPIDPANIQIFPNPTTNGMFTVQLKSTQFGSAEVVVFDMMGRVVRQFVQSLAVDNYEIPHLKKGMYFIRVTDSSSNSITQKLVVQ